MKGFGNKKAKKKVSKVLPDLKSDILISRAIKSHESGDISKAEEYYKLLIDKGVNNSVIYSNYALICHQRGEVDKAIILYNKSIKIDQYNPINYSNLAEIFLKKNNLKKAELLLKEAIRIKPEFANANTNIGIILQKQGKLEQAEIWLRKAIKIKPLAEENYLILGIILKEMSRLDEAEIIIKKAIKLNPKLYMAHLELSKLLMDNRNPIQAESYARKAIKLRPDLSRCHYNLGLILRRKGDLGEAELYLLKSLELDPARSEVYYALSTFKSLSNKKILQDNLLSEEIFKNRNQHQKIDIHFAKSNILHQQKDYKKSMIELIKANKIKLTIYPSKATSLIEKSKQLLIKSKTIKSINTKDINYPEYLFIVGMPRSGSTLLESILGMNKDIHDLGEVNILEHAYLEWQDLIKNKNSKSLIKLYSNQVNNLVSQFKTTTNKWLYNYNYTGIISSQIPTAKIIHCYRNPLDNILSIFRTHFAEGNRYSSSLIDCTKVYLEHDHVMTEYKKIFPNKIYDFNYDSLVTNPKEEIKSLIEWLNWNWNNSYLSPHLNNRTVSTASDVQVRFPINSKSLGGWKNYKELLRPVIEYIANYDKYSYLIDQF